MTSRMIRSGGMFLSSTKHRRFPPNPVGASVAAPTNTVAPVISGTAQVGATLTETSTGTWTGSPSFVSPDGGHQWQSNKTGSYVNIPGETGSSYIVQVADQGFSVKEVLTGGNAGGQASAASNIIGPMAAATGITAPTLAITSPLGTAPTSFSVVGDSTEQLGMFIIQEIIYGITNASNAQFNAGVASIGSGGITNYKQYQAIMDGQSWELNASVYPIEQGWVEPGGAYSSRAWFATAPGDPATNQVSGVSNIVGDTISSSVAVWTGATGTKKNANVTVTGSPALVMQGVLGNGFWQGVAATVQGGSKSQYEIALTTLATDSNRSIAFGRYNDTTDLSVNNVEPGVNDANGYATQITPGSTAVNVFKSNATQIGSFTLGSVAALSDVYTDELDVSVAAGSHVLKLYRAGTLVGTMSSQTLTGFLREFAMVKSNEKLTVNNGGTTFVHALNAGFTIYA